MTEIHIAGKSFEPREVIEHAKKARGWFAAIAAFSFINSMLVLFGVKVSFVIGLGATQVVDAVAAGIREEMGTSAAAMLSVIGLAINVCILGLVMVIWWACGRGSKTAYMVGMVLYAFDGLLFVLVGDWIGVGFHAFFLVMLWTGYGFMREWRNAEAFMARPLELPPPETYIAPTT